MKILKPAANHIFSISSDPEWPDIEFETDATGDHTWAWTVKWRSYARSGVVKTVGNKWNAKDVITDLGGTLSVKVAAAKHTARVAVLIKGTNPSASDVSAYLAGKANSAGFDKIIEHESKSTHFGHNKEPKRSFDHGYGMCQLTTPPPKFEQVWNWKRNVDGGLKLFEQKRSAAISYLSQSNRTYTSDQLNHEAVCRWNGGSYHEWDATSKQWQRKSTILCDAKTGNIGWDMTDAKNKGKTAAELHKRDAGGYSAPPGDNAGWGYFGVCYADRILD